MNAAQCIIKCDDEYMIAFNHKHNKYTPIGGKGEKGEISVHTLFRELKEEVGHLDIKNMNYLGLHTHIRDDGSSVGVHMYEVVINDKKILPKESFLEIVPLNKVEHLLNVENAYTSLLAIIEEIKNNRGGI